MTASAPTAIRAREILDYCRRGLEMLQRDPTGDDRVIQWAGTLSLLRTVGDALEKVDARADAKFRNAQSAWWKQIDVCRPSIFWKFIRRDRNLLLHEAELTAGQSTTVTLTGVEATALAGGQPNPPPKPAQPAPAASHSYHIKSGFYAGRDPRTLIEEAIAWWERQIVQIERDAAGR
jgi:hypothetical protein